MKARIDYTNVPEALRGMHQLEHYIHNSGLEESLVHLGTALLSRCVPRWAPINRRPERRHWSREVFAPTGHGALFACAGLGDGARLRNGDISLFQWFSTMGAPTADCIWQRVSSASSIHINLPLSNQYFTKFPLYGSGKFRSRSASSPALLQQVSSWP